jgi:hypothetical protein
MLQNYMPWPSSNGVASKGMSDLYPAEDEFYGVILKEPLR